MKLVFDIEADHLLEQVSQVWCIVARDVDTDKVYSFDPSQIKEGLQFLQDADMLIGHNIIDYDLRVLKKLYNFEYSGKLLDTLVYSRTIWPHLKELDYPRYQKGKFDSKLIGSHSLKAWGIRLGELKGDFNSGIESFSEYSTDMLDYCVQDTNVNAVLYHKIMEKNFNKDALELEQKLHTYLVGQEELGFCFDVDKAQALYSKLLGRRTEIEDELVSTFEPTIIEMKTKTKTIPFNPASRKQIADRLMRRGWEPEVFTDSGDPKVDETVLAGIDMPEAKLLNEYLMLNKRIGQLATGKQAWLKLQKKGKIHGRVNHMGAVTSRCTHNNPNTGQIPSVGAPYGKECRQLFTVPEGYSLLGADASGLELRCLAHYMAAFDGGAYSSVVLDGDVHTTNQEAAGLPSRSNAKTFIYGFLYGAGDEKIGKIIGKGSTEGKRIKNKFLKQLPALKKLKDKVSKAADKGFIKGLDGRIIPVRHSHAALNTLLQSCGAIICKTWYVKIAEAFEAENIDAKIVAFVHDEVQVQVKKGQEDEAGRLIQRCMRDTGQHFNFRCRLDSEYQYGSNWADTH